jgi:hypothetical protein
MRPLSGVYVCNRAAAFIREETRKAPAALPVHEQHCQQRHQAKLGGGAECCCRTAPCLKPVAAAAPLHPESRTASPGGAMRTLVMSTTNLSAARLQIRADGPIPAKPSHPGDGVKKQTSDPTLSTVTGYYSLLGPFRLERKAASQLPQANLQPSTRPRAAGHRMPVPSRPALSLRERRGRCECHASLPLRIFLLLLLPQTPPGAPCGCQPPAGKFAVVT